MAIFNKKSPMDKMLEDFSKLSDEDKAMFMKNVQGTEEVTEETTEETTEEQVEEQAEEQPEAVEEEEKSADEEVATATEEASKAEDNSEVLNEYREKFDAMSTRIASLEEKLGKYFKDIEEDEKPAESVGLEKSQPMNEVEDEDNMSAREYAIKHARY